MYFFNFLCMVAIANDMATAKPIDVQVVEWGYVEPNREIVHNNMVQKLAKRDLDLEYNLNHPNMDCTSYAVNNCFSYEVKCVVDSGGRNANIGDFFLFRNMILPEYPCDVTQCEYIFCPTVGCCRNKFIQSYKRGIEVQFDIFQSGKSITYKEELNLIDIYKPRNEYTGTIDQVYPQSIRIALANNFKSYLDRKCTYIARIEDSKGHTFDLYPHDGMIKMINLKPFTVHSFRYKMKCSKRKGKWSNWSEWIEVKTLPLEELPPVEIMVAPSCLHVVADGAKKCRIFWKSIPKIARLGPNNYFQIESMNSSQVTTNKQYADLDISRQNVYNLSTCNSFKKCKLSTQFSTPLCASEKSSSLFINQIPASLSRSVIIWQTGRVKTLNEVVIYWCRGELVNCSDLQWQLVPYDVAIYHIPKRISGTNYGISFCGQHCSAIEVITDSVSSFPDPTATTYLKAIANDKYVSVTWEKPDTFIFPDHYLVKTGENGMEAFKVQHDENVTVFNYSIICTENYHSSPIWIQVIPVSFAGGQYFGGPPSSVSAFCDPEKAINAGLAKKLILVSGSLAVICIITLIYRRYKCDSQLANTTSYRRRLCHSTNEDESDDDPGYSYFHNSCPRFCNFIFYTDLE